MSLDRVAACCCHWMSLKVPEVGLGLGCRFFLTRLSVCLACVPSLAASLFCQLANLVALYAWSVPCLSVLPLVEEVEDHGCGGSLLVRVEAL